MNGDKDESLEGFKFYFPETIKFKFIKSGIFNISLKLSLFEYKDSTKTIVTDIPVLENTFEIFQKLPTQY